MKINLILILFIIVTVISAQDYGEKKWEFETFPGVRTTPAIASDGTIYFGSDNYCIYALHPDGTLKWKYLTESWVFSSPAIGPKGNIYIGSVDGNLYSLTPDGLLRWKYNTSEISSSNGIWSSPAIGKNDIIYFGSTNDTLYALNLDGDKLWTFTTGNQILSSPAIDAYGNVYFGSNDSTLYSLGRSGELLWSFKTQGPIWFSSPAISSDGTIYIAADDSILYSLSKDGKLNWKYFLGGVVGNSPTIDENGVIYVGTLSYDWTLYAINPNGTKKWEFGRGEGFNSSATIGYDGTIYVGSNSTGLSAINPDGTTKWTTLVGPSEGSPVITQDSSILIGHYFGLTSVACENNKYANSSWPKFRHDNINSGDIINPVTEVTNDDEVINTITLSQNYPNPFNPTTNIKYTVPTSELVVLKVYDMLGRVAKTLVNEVKPKGTYTLEFSGSGLASGIYFYKIAIGKYSDVKKMVLLR